MIINRSFLRRRELPRHLDSSGAQAQTGKVHNQLEMGCGGVFLGQPPSPQVQLGTLGLWTHVTFVLPLWAAKASWPPKEEGKGFEDAFPTLLVNLAQWEKLFSKEARKKVIVGRQKGLKTHAPKLVSREQREGTVFSSITASRWVWDLANGERGWASGSSHVPFFREQRMDIPRSSQLKEF